jgi:hypothetical protein
MTQWPVASQAGALTLQSVLSVAAVHWMHMPGWPAEAPLQRSPFDKLQSEFDSQPTWQVCVPVSQKWPEPKVEVQSIGFKQATQFPDTCSQRGLPATEVQLLSKMHWAQLCVFELHTKPEPQSLSMVQGALQTLFALQM